MNIDTILHFVQSIAGTTQIHFFNVKEHGTFEVVPDTPLSILMDWLDRDTWSEGDWQSDSSSLLVQFLNIW